MYQDKVVLVTGGSRGIGACIADAYVAQGAKTIVFDLVPSLNENIDYYHVDLNQTEEVELAFSQIKAEYGALHILVNNAAISTLHKPLDAFLPEEFAQVLNVNLTAAFVCAREFTKANKGEDYGRIINIASTRWSQNESGWEAYGASKGGLVSLTHSLTVSLGDTPITVNAISPGWIQIEGYDQLKAADHAQHPSQRVGKARDIANACLFITHPENDFVNGTNLIVDGGMTKKMIYSE